MTLRLTCTDVRDQDLIERYAAGTLPENEAEALEAHALECRECWASIEQAVAIRSALVGLDAAEANDGDTRTPSLYRRVHVVGLAAAAVLVLAAGGYYLARREPSAETVILRGPADELTVDGSWQPNGALRLTWTTVPGATTYRVRITDRAGRAMTLEAPVSPLDVPALDLIPFSELSAEVEAENAAGEVLGRSAAVDMPHKP